MIHKEFGYIHSFYDEWHVYLLDRSLHVIRAGNVGMNGFPYQLIEMKSDDYVMPDGTRGKWYLGVKWHWRQTPLKPGEEPRDDPEGYSGFKESWVVWDDDMDASNALAYSTNRVSRPAEAHDGSTRK